MRPSKKYRSPGSRRASAPSIPKPASSLILSHRHDHILFKSDEDVAQSPQVIEPLLVIRFRGVAEFLVGPPHGHDNGAAIHPDLRLFCFHGFLKLWRQGLDTRLHESMLVEIQDRIEQLPQLLWFQIGRNFFLETQRNLRSLRLRDLVVGLDGDGGWARSDANLYTVEETLLVLSATVEFDDDFVVVERNIGYGYDLSGFDRLSVFLDFSLQFVFIDLTGLRQVNAVITKRQPD